jgi:hypothetical protein
VSNQKAADHINHGEGHRDQTQDAVSVVWCIPAEIIAPMMVMPEIALEPDISGVCRWAVPW